MKPLLNARSFFVSVIMALAVIWYAPQIEAAPDSNDTRGTWTATGALVSPSYACEATLLPDGNVLLAGRAGSSSTNSEIYEVASGTWTLTAPLNERRGDHTLTLLPNGKVLAAGGYNTKRGILSSAELFDPVSRTWTNTGAMISVHFKHTATLLPNGKVLVTGDYNGTNYITSSQGYNLITGKAWKLTDSRPDILQHYDETKVEDSKSDTNKFASAELYDPATGKWQRTASLNRPRGLHTATLLTNGLFW